MSKLRYSELFYSLQGEGRYVGVPSVFLRLFGCNFECTGFGQDRDRSKWLDNDKMPHNQEHLDVKVLEDLPVPHVGCDSSFSWGKKWGHLASNDEIEIIIQKMNELTNWYGEKNSATMSGGLSSCFLQDDGVHLVITGGEPLLKGLQQGVFDLMTNPDLKTRFVTIETNGTQIFSPHDYCNDGYMFPDHHRKFGVNKNAGMTFSVSPKLSNSGELWEDAIRPEALASYNAWPHSYLYLKFVVRDEEDMSEVEEAVRTYDHARVNIDAVYLMPETGMSIDFKIEQKIAELALKYGYKYSPRLQINLFGNEWGT
jgi:organic radical activating enzyme